MLDIDYNNLITLVTAVVVLVNTFMTMRANATAKATKEIAVETREIVQKAEINTIEEKKERAKISILLDDALKVVGKRK